MPRTSATSHRPTLLVILLILVMTIVCGVAPKLIRGSTSESVIISVTVTDASSSSISSSASSSSESSASSASSSSSITSSSSAFSSDDDDSSEPGGRRSRSSSSRRSSEPSHGAACPSPFLDVPEGVWYEDELYELVSDGIIDCARFFRPRASAVRAEYAKVIVKAKGIENPVDPDVPSYDDAQKGEWYYPYVEEASTHTWMRGYGDCYGTRPCFVRPESVATRAEAVAMILRSYRYEKLNRAPAFADVESYAWYKDVIQAAADRCILQGDDETGLVAPNRLVNRAEMVVLFSRAREGLLYGRDCGVDTHSSAPEPLKTIASFEASKDSNKAIVSYVVSIMMFLLF